MADMLLLPGRAAGAWFEDTGRPGDVVTWQEPRMPTQPPGAIAYERMAALGDTSASAILYTVELEVAEADLPAVFAWYEGEHLPMLTSVPGCRGGARYRRLDGGTPNLLAAYRFDEPGIPETPAWIAARSTAWTARVRPLFRSSRRFIRRLVA